MHQIQEAFAEDSLDGLPARAYEQLAAYLELLLRWNTRLNLSAIREPEQIIRRHFVECAFAAQQLPTDIESLLDYGSGAGLPGIVFAICRPEICVTLAEAHGKKASFLREAVRAVATITAVYDRRVESMPEGRLFDAVSMRAVEKMKLALPIALQRAERYLVLFTTERSTRENLELQPEFRWMEPIRLPNTEQMILAIGRRS